MKTDEVEPRLAHREKPRACCGSPSAPKKSGRSIDEKPGWKPVHQMTFATTSARPSEEQRPFAHAGEPRATGSDAAAGESADFTRMRGPPCETTFGRALRPSGVLVVSTRWKTTRSTSRARMSRPASPPMRNGICPTSLPDIHVGWPPRATSSAISAPELPGPDDEDASLPELGEVAVLAGVQLEDVGAELARARRHPRALVGRHRHDHVVGLEPPVACLEGRPAPSLR